MVAQQAAGYLATALQYVRNKYWELPANILEGITLVLVVFVQDLIFKESIIICAGLLTVSFGLHGLAYRAGQCQLWPKAIEIAAPLLFYAMAPAAYLQTYWTYKSSFIIINFWFVTAELLFWAFGRNFIAEYLQDWSPREIWGTPLLQHCARVVAVNWIICQVIMGLAQVVVVVANISIDTNLVAAIFMCYVMQLLPLLWAVLFTFAYPARVKQKWGYVRGVRASCYPPYSSDSRHSAAGACATADCATAAAAGGTDGWANSDKGGNQGDNVNKSGKSMSSYSTNGSWDSRESADIQVVVSKDNGLQAQEAHTTAGKEDATVETPEVPEQQVRLVDAQAQQPARQ